MSFFLISSALLVAAIVVSLGVAEVVTQPWIAARTTKFSAGLIGVALCTVVAFMMLFALDLDPIYGETDWLSRARRTMPVTGLSAILWLPVFLMVYSMRRRRVEG